MVNIDLSDYLVNCDPDKDDIEISVKYTYTNTLGSKLTFDLAVDFDELEIGHIKISKDIDKVSELTFDILEKAETSAGFESPAVFNEISVEYINHTTNKTSNVFYGYVLTKSEKSSSRHSIKRYSYKCVAYEKALYDTIIVETWNDMTAKEIIEKVWTERLVGTSNYNFPNPVIDPALTDKLGKISHEDSIERIITILATRTDSVWWFDDFTTLHFYKKSTIKNNEVMLQQADYDKIATPIKWDSSLVKYANQVKFKAKDIRGNSNRRTFDNIANNGEYSIDTTKIHSFEKVYDLANNEYKQVGAIDKTSTLHQFVMSGDKITFYPQPNGDIIYAELYYKYSTIIVKNDIAEQSRLKNFMQIGYVISKDITNERLKTIEQVRDYCSEYLKRSTQPTYSAGFTIHNLQTDSSLSRWGFDIHSYNFKGMQYKFTDKNDCNIKFGNYPNRDLMLTRKTITFNRKNSRVRTKQVYDKTTGKFIQKDVATLSNEDFIISNEFVDGFRDIWEDRFKRDKKQIFDQDINDKDLQEINIDEQVFFDIIADDLTVDGILKPVTDTTLKKSRETHSITQAMVG